ncbi:MAG: MetQ/NlpA family ABC transporter substrate-binding protein [Ruthenibacterium sp.]|jgi:D-methionine transport system substrate-binding protein
MKKFTALCLVLCLALVLAACGAAPASSAASGSAGSLGAASDAEGTVTLKVGASPSPHAEILEHAADLLAAEGITLDIVEFDDYVMPNTALQEGSLDANYFQHEPYLLNFNAENGTNLVSAGAIHYEPLGVYAGKSDDLANVPDGAVIGIPADATNGGRALLLLQECGVLTLKDGISIDTFRDAEANAEAINFTEYDGIAENPHNVKIEALVADMLPAALPDLDFAVINGNYALPAGISDKLLANEDAGGEAPGVFANIIAVRAGDEAREDIQKLVSVLKSDEMKDWITSNYEGSVLPAA